MRFLLISSLVFGGAFLFPEVSRGNQQPSFYLVAEDNVNHNYTVESIEVAGDRRPELPVPLRDRVASLIGSRFDPAKFDELAGEIRKELHLRSVRPYVVRGSAPGRVRVMLQTEGRTVQFDVSVPKFLYSTSQGPSAQLQASTTIARTNVIRFGLISDGDELSERYSGFTVAYDNLHTGSSRVRTEILLQEFHEQWNSQAEQADGPDEPDIYRSRRNVQPSVVLLVSKSVTVTAGASFEELEMENPGKLQAANTLNLDLRYHKDLESSGTGQQEIGADYNLRAGLEGLGSDYAYERHLATARYAVSVGRNTLSDEVVGGLIEGNAPLFERFAVGNSSLLRGWNRFEIDPLGGNRLAHNSVNYGFHVNSGTVQAFYDAGMLWDKGESAPVRQSVGVGYRQSVFSAALAFPLRGGRVEPVLMLGMNY